MTEVQRKCIFLCDIVFSRWRCYEKAWGEAIVKELVSFYWTPW